VDEEGFERTVCRFRSSGRQLPVCTGSRVIRLVASKSLHGICNEPYATISQPDVAALLLAGRKAVSKATWASNEQLLGQARLDCDIPLPGATICFICHQGWADESSGPLHRCGGKCQRAFHTGCYTNFLPTLVCGLCTGTDTVVCCVCNHEWSDPCKESDFYTGLLVECVGGCDRHFHQECHVVRIQDAETRETAPPFHCADCKAGRSHPDSTTQQPPPPRTTPDVSRGAESTASVVDAPMEDAPTEEAAEVESGREGEPAVAMESDIPSAAIALTLVRGSGGKLGMRVLHETNVVQSVTSGGAAERAGLLHGDRVVGVGLHYLSQFLKFEELLPSGLIGSRLTLSVLRATTQTVAPPPASAAAAGGGGRPARKRGPPPTNEGMCSLDGVRLSDNLSGDGVRLSDNLSGKRVARQARAFPENTGDHF